MDRGQGKLEWIHQIWMHFRYLKVNDTMMSWTFHISHFSSLFYSMNSFKYIITNDVQFLQMAYEI